MVNKVGKLGNTALHWASSGGHSKVVTALIKAKANLNAQNAVKDTPLHLAAWRDRVEALKLLTSAGATKGVKNQNGKTAFDLARSQEGRDVLLTMTTSEAKSSIVMASDDESSDDE